MTTGRSKVHKLCSLVDVKMALSARSSVSLGHRLMKALGSFAPKHSGHEKLGKLDNL